MSITNVHVVTLVGVECCNCHVVFGLSAAMNADRLRDHKSFYCPSGHGQSYTGETEEARLKRQLAAANGNAKAATERADFEERRAAAYKGHLTRHKKAAANGDCPVCSKHFERLRQHMRLKHPEYIAEAKS